jgi:hypothetical protein
LTPFAIFISYLLKIGFDGPGVSTGGDSMISFSNLQKVHYIDMLSSLASDLSFARIKDLGKDTKTIAVVFCLPIYETKCFAFFMRPARSDAC